MNVESEIAESHKTIEKLSGRCKKLDAENELLRAKLVLKRAEGSEDIQQSSVSPQTTDATPEG